MEDGPLEAGGLFGNHYPLDLIFAPYRRGRRERCVGCPSGAHTLSEAVLDVGLRLLLVPQGRRRVVTDKRNGPR